MVTKDDIRLALQYFALQSPEHYTAAEIAVHKALLKEFVAFTHRLLGLPKRVIRRRLISLAFDCSRERERHRR